MAWVLLPLVGACGGWEGNDAAVALWSDDGEQVLVQYAEWESREGPLGSGDIRNREFWLWVQDPGGEAHEPLAHRVGEARSAYFMREAGYVLTSFWRDSEYVVERIDLDGRTTAVAEPGLVDAVPSPDGAYLALVTSEACESRALGQYCDRTFFIVNATTMDRLSEEVRAEVRVSSPPTRMWTPDGEFYVTDRRDVSFFLPLDGEPRNEPGPDCLTDLNRFVPLPPTSSGLVRPDGMTVSTKVVGHLKVDLELEPTDEPVWPTTCFPSSE